jgi:hypothetical protein
MKKMLTLVLILAIATLANAAPTWTNAYNSSTHVVNVTITNNEGSLYIGLAVDPLEGALSGFAPGANFQQTGPARMALVPDEFDSGYGTGEIWVMMDGATEPAYTDGEWLTANFAFAQGSTHAIVHVFEFFEDETVASRGDIIIPEPITMTLLGLGGLFLRRRK